MEIQRTGGLVMNERVVIDLNRSAFDNAVLMALEKDTGAVPICGEIIRILKIAMRKEQVRNQRIANLRGVK